MAESDIIEQKQSLLSWLGNWWSPMSAQVLRDAEKKLLSCLTTSYKGFYVDIGSVVGTLDKIWTISLNQESNKTPIVLLHGLGAGVGLWCLNLDSFAKHRPVFAIDVLGFGRSSRPDFSCDADEAEKQLVLSVEEWRSEMKINKMMLLGHSMGGFLATSYALSYPDRVKHLILADPWGFQVKPSAEEIAQRRSKLPLWARVLISTLQPFNPLWAIRVAGPFGQKLIEKTRPDLVRKFSSAVNGNTEVISQYIFQCNSQKPSGEGAFHAMTSGLGWAKNPMVKRMDLLKADIPMTVLFGSESWIDNGAGQVISEKRPESSFTDIKTIAGAGHHVYADQSDVFNDYVNAACEMADQESENSEGEFNCNKNNNKTFENIQEENSANKL